MSHEIRKIGFPVNIKYKSQNNKSLLDYNLNVTTAYIQFIELDIQTPKTTPILFIHF